MSGIDWSSYRDMYGGPASSYPPSPTMQPPYRRPPVAAAPQRDEVSPDSVIKVYRVMPSRPRGVAGYYKSYPYSQMDDLETLVRSDFQSGEYRYDVFDNAKGRAVRTGTFTIAGDAPLDSSKKPIPSDELDERVFAARSTVNNPPGAVRKEQNGFSLGASLYPGEHVADSVQAVNHLTMSNREMKEEIVALRRRVEELNEIHANAKGRISELESALRQKDADIENERRINNMREEMRKELDASKLEQARIEASMKSGKKDPLEFQVEMLRSQQEMWFKMMAENKNKGGILETLEVMERIDEMRNGRGGGDDDGVTGIIGSFAQMFAGFAQARAAGAPPVIPAGTPLSNALPAPAPQAAPAAPQAPAAQPMTYDTTTFKKALAMGMKPIIPEMNAVEVNGLADEFAEKALKMLTEAGKDAALGIKDEESLMAFAQGTHLDPARLKMALVGRNDRIRWLFSSVGHIQRRIQEERGIAAPPQE